MLLFLMLTSVGTTIYGQDDLLVLPPKFFTLRNFKVTLGANISANFVTSNSKGTTFMNQSQGELPSDLKIRYDTSMSPILNFGVSLDISSSNSILGLLIGAEYQSKAFQLHDNNGKVSYEIGSYKIPAYLKLQFGSVHSRHKALLMFGGNYTIPNSLERSGILRNSVDVKELQPYFNLSGVLGWQIGFGKTRRDEKVAQALFDKENARDQEARKNAQSTLDVYESVGVPSRIWLFVRFDAMKNSLFNPDFNDGIMQLYSANQLDYRDLEITVGAAFFFGAKK